MFEKCDYLSILLIYMKKSTTTTRSYSFMQFYFYLFFASSALTYALNSVINSRLNVGHGCKLLENMQIKIYNRICLPFIVKPQKNERKPPAANK